jgi:hypothetical protein
VSLENPVFGRPDQERAGRHAGKRERPSRSERVLAPSRRACGESRTVAPATTPPVALTTRPRTDCPRLARGQRSSGIGGGTDDHATVENVGDS